MGFYPLETMVYARTLTIRFLLNGACAQGTGKFKTYRDAVGRGVSPSV